MLTEISRPKFKFDGTNKHNAGFEIFESLTSEGQIISKKRNHFFSSNYDLFA